MKLIKKICAATLVAAALPAGSLFGGETKVVKEVIIEEPEKWWGVDLSTGWDSRYIFRGVDVIPGSSLYWLSGFGTINLTENDSITAGLWQAWGLTNTRFSEMDVSVAYERTIGDFAIGVGYTFYWIQEPLTLYSHELNAGIAYEADLGFMTLTPSMFYYFNIAPSQDDGGYTPYASSYLALRLDGSIPVPIWMKDGEPRISLDPWVGLNFSFKYNFSERYDEYFSGVNNFEFGVAMPVQITDFMAVSGYVASSYQWAELLGTAPALVWAGVSVNFSF